MIHLSNLLTERKELSPSGIFFATSFSLTETRNLLNIILLDAGKLL